MRRVVIFVVALALGASLLWWFARRSKPALPLTEGAAREPLAPITPQRGELTTVTDTHGKPSQFALSGPFEDYSKDDSRPDLPLKYHFAAGDSRTLGEGGVDFSDVLLEQFSPETHAKEVVVVAQLARARITQHANGPVKLDEGYPITLRETVINYEVGSRFAPVTLRVPTLEAVLGLESGTSKDDVTVEGRGLSARGKGLSIDGRSESLRLLVDPSATVQIDEKQSAALSSHGELAIRSRPDLGPEIAEIEAREGARLVLSGDEPFALDADIVRLFGRVERGEPSRFVPTRGEAEGHVRLVPREGVFVGERALVEFDATGKLARAALDGAPQLELVLRGTALANLPPEMLVEGETLTVQLSGAGPLELFYTDGERFLFTGPARLELPSLAATLECNASIAGALDDDGRFHELVADGDVRFRHELLTLSTTTLTIILFLDTLGKDAARLTSSGATRIDGALADASPIALEARGGLVFERRRSNFFVPRANDFTLDLGGAEPLHASAEVLHDFDAELSTFIAEGRVELVNAEGRGRGERLEAWGRERGELSGLPNAPARFEFAQGEFEAQFVELHSNLMHARGDAHAHVVLDGLDYDLASRWVVVERRAALEDQTDAHDVAIDAGGGVVATLLELGQRVVIDSERFHALADEVEDLDGKREYAPTLAVAAGDVHFELVQEATLVGDGERLELYADGSGRLLPARGERVHLRGDLPGGKQRFRLSAEQVDFAGERLTALGPVADIEGLELAWSSGATDLDARKLRAVAGYLTCDRSSILLNDGVYLGGKTADLEDWSLDAEHVQLQSAPIEGDVSAAELVTLVQDLVAWGGFTARLGTLGLVRGGVLELSNSHRSLSIQGDPTSPLTRDAVIDRAGTVWASPRFDIALDTGYLRSDAGRASSADPGAPDSWTLQYDALEPLPMGDQTVLALRQPVWTNGDAEVRANWAMLWLDAAEWRKATALGSSRDKTRRPDPDAPRRSRGPRSMFGKLNLDAIGPWLHELYLDGNVEYRVHGERKAAGEGMYLDLVEGNGWLLKFVVDVDFPIFGRTYQLKVQAEWMRPSLDGTLLANGAVATTCAHDVPHFVIKIGSFTVAPRFKDEIVVDKRTGEEHSVRKRDGWDLSLDDNSIQFIGALALPLPRIAGPMNNDFEFDKDAFTVGNFRLPSFGQDSKFGTFISASVTRDIGYLGRQFHLLLNRLFAPNMRFPDIQGSTRTHVDLNNRGLVVGTESTFEAPGKYRWSVVFDAIYDHGEDHGLVRVDRDDRSDFRGWFHSRGRYLLGPDEWIDAVISKQTDPGVQSEFFEGDYLRYAERETYLHWRRAQDEYFWSATVEGRLEDFRTEVVEAPSINVFKGRSEIGEIAGHALVQSSHLSIERLARFDGDPLYEAPFVDGLGDRSVLRFDALERVEAPLSTGVFGSRITPFVVARATGWSENADEDSRAARAALIAGVQLSTTFWKSFAGGARHVWSPSISYRGDLVHVDGGDPVVFFDAGDVPIEGRFLDLALRSRWENRELKSDLDIELVQTHADGVDANQPDGWLPLAARGTWLSMISGMPFGVTHDARYDTGSGDIDYSRTFLGLEPFSGFDLETGYHQARDASGARLYNALTLGARYALSPKWEIEGKETISARDNNDQLASSLTLRRFGHDFVFEIESSYTAGEGSGSLRFNFMPLFAWRRNEMSMLDKWRALRQ